MSFTLGPHKNALSILPTSIFSKDMAYNLHEMP